MENSSDKVNEKTQYYSQFNNDWIKQIKIQVLKRGMPISEFWRCTPLDLADFIIAHDLAEKDKQENMKAEIYKQGEINYFAFLQVAVGMFGGKKTSKSVFPSFDKFWNTEKEQSTKNQLHELYYAIQESKKQYEKNKKGGDD